MRTLMSALSTGLLLVTAADVSAQQIVPQPVSVATHAGRFTITPRTVIATDAASAPIGRQLANYLEPATGFSFRVVSSGAPPAGSIVLRRDRSLTRLGEEGYLLDVRSSGVSVRAHGAAGLFYGVQTLRQLLPPAIFREAPVEGVEWSMPAVAIEDYPRFQWRGGHLDVARHFMPKEFVKKYIDLLALHKMNVFHWHLTEDQGWRIEIKQYPKLTEVGAWRKETLVGRPQRDSPPTFDGKRHGGFYTQDDAREIVAYARARHVTVVPEIEMPGHATAAIAAYPELGITGEPLEVAKTWGIFSDIFNADPSTIRFLQNVLTEVLAIFPGRYIHVGGDEADKAKWKASERIQARIRELKLKDEHELQSWFIRQMDEFLVARKRRLVGWDEILEGGLAENAVVMSWRGNEGRDRRGARRPRRHHGADKSHLPGLLPVEGPGGTSHSRSAAFFRSKWCTRSSPFPRNSSRSSPSTCSAPRGSCGPSTCRSPKQVEYMAFPRMSALAEVVWTPKGAKGLRRFPRAARRAP